MNITTGLTNLPSYYNSAFQRITRLFSEKVLEANLIPQFIISTTGFKSFIENKAHSIRAIMPIKEGTIDMSIRQKVDEVLTRNSTSVYPYFHNESDVIILDNNTTVTRKWSQINSSHPYELNRYEKLSTFKDLRGEIWKEFF
jgi:hypothetical protein